jgi:hypothetical protein
MAFKHAIAEARLRSATKLSAVNKLAAQRTMHAETLSFAATAYNTLCENIACRSYNAHRLPRTVQGTHGSMNNVVSYHLS